MKRFLAVVACALCLACLGCGGSKADLGEVTGIVTLDGQALPDALVTFTPTAGGRGSSGATDANGKYTLGYGDQPGALVGEHRVRVTTMGGGGSVESADASLNESSDSAAYEAQAMGGGTSDYDNAKVVEKLPARYNTETELTFSVAKGSNTYDIPLKRD